MNLEELTHIIEEIYQNALEDKRYRFGLKSSRKVDKVSSGSLLKSIKAIPKDGEIGVQMSDYGKYVDSGRKPGSMPPVKEILAWVKQNNLTSRDKTKEQIAFGIANKIKKFGIRPSNWFEVAETELLSSKEFEELMADAAVQAIMEELNIN